MMHMYASSIFFGKFVATLGSTIRAIRQRLKRSGTGFADLIGTDQSTVSRYEANQVVPSRTVLILLLLLASEEERPAIREAMGDIDEAMLTSQLIKTVSKPVRLELVWVTFRAKAGSPEC